MIQDKSKKGLSKAFFSYSIPCILGMFLTSFITVVDGIFIGNKIGGHGLAAVNITLPVLYLLLGISIMTGVGGVTIATHSFGAKDLTRARQRFTLTLLLNAALIIFAVLLLRIFLDDIVVLLRAQGEVYSYVKDYLGTMSFFYFFMMMNIVFSMFIRGERKPVVSLFFGLAGNIINIILDYLFIIKLDYGMKGAALASGIAVVIPFVLGCTYFVSGKSAYKPVKPDFIRTDIRSIIFNGFSEFIGQISICITTYLFNYVLMKRIGIDGVAAFTIAGYVSFFQNMILTGIAQGINTLISYSYGARDSSSIKGIMSIAVRASFAVGIVTFFVMMFSGEAIARIFAGNNSNIVELARNGMRIFAAVFLFNGYNFVASSYFTSMGDAKTSAILSMIRSLVLISVFILVLPMVLGDTGIWLASPLTEAATFALSLFFVLRSGAKLRFTKGQTSVDQPELG